MKSGYSIIRELGKHGLRGYYFSYRQYKTLAKIKEFSEAKETIAEWGYPEVRKADDVSEVIVFLKKSNELSTSQKGCLTAMFLEPLFWLSLLLLGGC